MRPGRAAALGLCLVGLVACSRRSPTGVSLASAVREPSGLVASANYSNVFWTHGDSGTGNWLFAVGPRGQLLARLRVEGAENVDWEDITRDDRGHLWLGDIGNNSSTRHDLRVHRLRELDPRTDPDRVEVELSVPYHFPSPPPSERRPDHDAEALMWWRDSLWLLTKHRANDLTRLYRFPKLDGDEVELEPVAAFDLGPYVVTPRLEWSGMSTAADAAPSGDKWALLTYDGALVFALPSSGEGSELFDRLLNHIEFDPKKVRQAEAIAWDGDALIIVNEERAVFRVEDPLTEKRL